MNTRVFFLRQLACALVVTFASLAPRAEPTAATVLITGSNRGIGLELARAYAEKGWKVIATCRNPDGAAELKAIAATHPAVVIEKLDVTDHAMVDALAARYRGTPIDVLVNNAGISGGMPSQTFGHMDYAGYRKVLDVNTIGPMKMAEAFAEHVKASTQRKIITVSTGEGSIAGVRSPRLYWYRSSKSAVNMLMRNLALELKGSGVIVGLVNPGPTDTDLMKGVKIPLRKPEVAARDLIGLIEGFTLETTGSFLNYDGQVVPW
jgi:NAD(P)-dependent dehydrogenase (short-subunit alcohol dehydrogenase family)